MVWRDEVRPRVLFQGGHVHKAVVLLEIDVAVRFAKRRLRLKEFGGDKALDDDLGFRRHQQVDGLALDHVKRSADQPAGDVELVQDLRHLLHRRVGHRRRAAKHDRAGQFSARLHGGLRLIVKPQKQPPPTKPDGGLDWLAIDSIYIVEMVDYHD